MRFVQFVTWHHVKCIRSVNNQQNAYTTQERVLTWHVSRVQSMFYDICKAGMIIRCAPVQVTCVCSATKRTLDMSFQITLHYTKYITEDVWLVADYLPCKYKLGVEHIELKISTLMHNNTMWRHISGSKLVQVMAWSLTATSHYQSQCCLIINRVLWHSSERKSGRT